MAEEKKLPHRLVLDERQDLHTTGVTEVISFDESTIVLRTCLGTLVVQGTDLKLKALSPDGGTVAVTGSIGAISYEESRGSRLRHLFG